jgi:hypothetical protein
VVKIQAGRQQLPFRVSGSSFVSLGEHARERGGERCSCLPGEKKERGVRIRKPEYEALCTFDLCIGIAAKSSHVYGTLVPSCLIERPWRTGGRGPFLVGQFGRPWCGEGPTMTGWRARVEPRAHQMPMTQNLNHFWYMIVTCHTTNTPPLK